MFRRFLILFSEVFDLKPTSKVCSIPRGNPKRRLPRRSRATAGRRRVVASLCRRTPKNAAAFAWLVQKVGRNFSSVLREFFHDLFMQPDVH